METLSTTAQDDSSGANPSSVKSEDSSPRNETGRGSPPPNCAICLGTCRNKSFTDTCLHEFCFKCLLTWSKVKAVCPLCKQNFRSIIHNVRSNHQYDEYTVEQRHTEEITERLDIDTLTTRRFRYRTTLTLPRRESIAIQQLLMHYPLMADVFPSPRSPAAPPAPSSTAPPLRRRSPASFRRSVYRYNLWARPLPDFTGRFRDCSPEFYRYNDSQIHRLVPWLNRELHYLLNENAGHIAYVISRIIELLPEYHITSSDFRETMRSYFGDRTRHFLHELYNFASTPYDMTGYDRNVQYTTDPRMSTMVNEVISSSESEASADSDIVMISSSEPAEPPPGPSRVPAPVYPNNYIPEPINNIIPIETISQSDTDDDSSEVMVVGYIKPPQDRTPEVVDLLGSDSDVMVQETSEPPPVVDASESRPGPLVKLTMTSTLSRSNSTDSTDSEGSAYTPSPPPRRRHASQDSDMSSEKFCTSDFSGDSIARKAAHPSSQSSSSSSLSSSSTSYTSWNESESSYDNVKRKKARRKLTATERNKRKTKKRPSRKQHKSRKTSNTQEKKQSKRKSHSGKGVKSTKKNSEVIPELPSPDLDQPSTSGTGRNRKHKLDVTKSPRTLSRESKRLKSVVSVIKAPNESSSSSKTNVQPNSNVGRKPRDCNSDSEDDLPLNLTITKTS